MAQVQYKKITDTVSSTFAMTEILGFFEQGFA